MSKKAPKMPKIEPEDGIERYNSYTRLNPIGHKELVVDGDEEILNELGEDIIKLLESISFGGMNHTGAGAGSPEQLHTDRRHNRLLPSSRDEDINNMTASTPRDSLGPEDLRAINLSNSDEDEKFSDKDIAGCNYTVTKESFTGTGAIAISPGVAPPTPDEDDEDEEEEIKMESKMNLNDIQKLLNEWQPSFVAGEYSPGDGGVDSPKGNGVQSAKPKHMKGNAGDLKNHGDAFNAKHNETAAMCDVEESGVETKPQGDHESTVGDPVDGHQQKIGHDWPNQPKHHGGSAEAVKGTRYTNSGTMSSSVHEEWNSTRVGSLPEGDIDLQRLFDEYARSRNMVCTEDFQNICNANWFKTKLTDDNLIALMSVNREFMFYEGEDANGLYWKVTPIAEAIIRSRDDELVGPDLDMEFPERLGQQDQTNDEDEIVGDYDDGEGRYGGDGCPECGAYCGYEDECPECGCEVGFGSDEQHYGPSIKNITKYYTPEMVDDMDEAGLYDDNEDPNRFGPPGRRMGESLNKFLLSAKGILESARKGSNTPNKTVGEALVHSWKAYAKGINPTKTPIKYRKILETIAQKFDIFRTEIMEGVIGSGGFKPGKLPDQPKPEDVKKHGEPLGKKLTNDSEQTPVIKGTEKGLSGKSTGKISAAVKENIAKLSNHVQKCLKESVRTLRGRFYPQYQVQVAEGKSINLTPARNSLAEALADAEEILQYHSAKNVDLKASFKDSKGEVVMVRDVPLLTIKPRGLVATEGAALFRFRRNAEKFAKLIVSEGKICRVVPHQWGTAVIAEVTADYLKSKLAGQAIQGAKGNRGIRGRQRIERAIGDRQRTEYQGASRVNVTYMDDYEPKEVALQIKSIKREDYDQDIVNAECMMGVDGGVSRVTLLIHRFGDMQLDDDDQSMKITGIDRASANKLASAVNQAVGEDFIKATDMPLD